MQVQYHLDESVHGAIAEGLALLGISVTTPKDAGLLQAADEAHLAFALADGRVIITRDTDFLRFHGQGVEHAGIVFWTETQRTLGQLIRALDALAGAHTAEELRGQVIYL
jgi:uncharacterized protein with PIN domain